MLERLLPRLWQRRGLVAVLLLPLSAIFWLVSGVRRAAYVCGVCRSERLPVPLVVIGNIIVGGSGKTPLTLWLADALRRMCASSRAQSVRSHPVFPAIRSVGSILVV